MFYRWVSDKSGKDAQSAEVSAIVSLTPSESKRLIAKAVVKLPEVRRAWQKGLIIIRHGTTCAFVAEELLGITINKSDFVSGSITGGELTGSISPTKLTPFVIRDGKQVDISGTKALQEFTPDDVLIKSANAVDREGNAGVLVGAEAGIGPASALAYVRGFHLIVPVGLEKLVPSVPEAAKAMPGIYRLKYCTGMPVSLILLVTAKVVTEIQAFEILCGVSTTHIASGGIGGSEGSVVLHLTGSEQEIEEALRLVKAVKGEPPVAEPSQMNPPASGFNYDVKHFHESIWPVIAPKILPK